ncbi:MAG: hypothetical protein H6564_23880 [Lewinellaceae bacterium]|nr:hypothetical protein [Lewinellaceae bacterium]
MKKLRSFSRQAQPNGSSIFTFAPKASFPNLYQLRLQSRAAVRRSWAWWKQPPGQPNQESTPATELDDYD